MLFFPAASNPFLSAHEAKTMLAGGDLGRLRGVTTQFGLRSDISDGWEEYFIITPKQVRLQIEIRCPVLFTNVYVWI